MDVELNPGPASSSLRSKRKWPYRECRSGRTVKVRKATKVLIFNPPWHLVVTNLHFTQDGTTTILFVFRWYKIGHAEVHHEVSLFGMLAHWKPKYRSYVILCHLVVLTFYLWINCGLPRTIALPLPTSLIYLKITLFITCLDPPAEEVDLLLSHAKGFMFREIKAVVFYVRTFWFNHHLWWQGFSPCDSISTSTAQEKWLYSRKNFLRILCVLRGVDCYILPTPSLRWLQLSRRWQLKCKRLTILWLSFFCLSTITTRVDPALSRTSEFVKQGWPQHVEDLRLQTLFTCRFQLSVEQDCLPWGLRVIIPTQLSCLQISVVINAIHWNNSFWNNFEYKPVMAYLQVS